MSSEISEISLRYLKEKKTFEIKFFDSMDPMPIEEEKVKGLIESFPDVSSKKLFGLIVDAARNDPKGGWVSASSEPVKQGQVLLKV